MLKKVSFNPPLNITYVTDGAGLDKLKKFTLRKQGQPLGWDKETNYSKDFWWRKDRLWQLGDHEEQYVVDLLALIDGNADALANCQGHYGLKMDKRLQPVIDIFTPVLCTNNYLKVGVNLGFEYEQSYWNFGMRTWHLFSVDMVERCIQAGFHSLKDYDFFSMETMMARYFNVQIDKELQTSFSLDGALTQDQIEYAAKDTRYPLALRSKQLPIIENDDLVEVSQIENDAIGAFIDMHVHGQRINTEKWKQRADRKIAELQEVLAELDKFFIPIVGHKDDMVAESEIEEMKAAWKAKTIVTDEEIELKAKIKKEKDPATKLGMQAILDSLAEQRLQEKEALKKKCSERSKLRTKQKNMLDKCEGNALLNYQSNPVMLAMFKEKVKGMSKLKSTNDDDLKDYDNIPVVKSFRKYRELSKQIKTYGYSFINTWTTGPGKDEGWLHPGDGRLHPKFNQLDAETGRSTSSQPNGQNLPQDETLRSCFEADPPDESIRISRCCQEECKFVVPHGDIVFGCCPKCGSFEATDPEEYVIVTADMAGAELRILAELADEKVWIAAFDRNEDVHEVCAEKMYQKEWPEWAAEGCAYYKAAADGKPAHLKCKCPIHKEKRDEAKVPNFLIPYGGGAPNLAAQTGKTTREAEEILANHKKSFPTLWDYLDKSGEDAKNNEEARDMFNRRRAFPKPTMDLAREALIVEAKTDENSRWERCMRKDPKKLGVWIWDNLPGKAKAELYQTGQSDNWYGMEWAELKKLAVLAYEHKELCKPKKDQLWEILHDPLPLRRDVSSYLAGMHGRIERQGKNHAIQGTNASIAKLAMGCGFCKNGIPFLWHTLPKFKAKQLAFVHDELIILCPKRYGQQVADLIGDAFRRAAAEKMVKVVMKFDYHIEKHWQK